MITFREAVAAQLAADETITETATGGIWTRPIRQGTGPGATPGAFEVNPSDPAKVVRMRPCISIQDGGEFPRANLGNIGASTTYLTVMLHAPSTQAGKEALEEMDRRVMSLLDGVLLDAQGYWAGEVEVGQRTDILEGESIPGTLHTGRQLVIDWARGPQGT